MIKASAYTGIIAASALAMLLTPLYLLPLWVLTTWFGIIFLAETVVTHHTEYFHSRHVPSQDSYVQGKWVRSQ